MATNGSDLPTYEEIVGSLDGKLMGLSAVRQELAEAEESLDGARLELGDAKRGIDALAASSQGMLEEVRRLKPGERGATLDAGLTRASREMSEGLGALSARLMALGGEVAAGRDHAEGRFVALDQRLVVRDEAVQQRLSDIEHSFASSLAEAQQAVVETVASSNRTTQGALANVRERQDFLLKALVDVQRRQEDLARRHDALLLPLAELRQHQADLSQRVASVS